MDYAVIIPARYASTRFPGKPLAMINGKTMIQHVWERSVVATSADRVYVATDNREIFEIAEGFGANVLMTSSDCATGTDRVAEANEVLKKDFIINVQGDEPMINPADIRLVRDRFAEDGQHVVNAYTKLSDDEDARNLTLPKVAVSKSGRLMYMSRAPIPCSKRGMPVLNCKQVCIYAFGKDHLKFILENPLKTPLESIEDIEILRFIENDISVKMVEVKNQGFAVDTPEDLERVRGLLPSNE